MAAAREQIVDVPVDLRGFCDVYIDDIVVLGVDEGGNAERIEGSVLLAIATTARPPQEHEPLPREEMEARKKIVAEAAAEKTKTILGWTFDFRHLLISLPANKFTAWS